MSAQFVKRLLTTQLRRTKYSAVVLEKVSTRPIRSVVAAYLKPLSGSMNTTLLPEHWKTFVAKYSLVGAEIELPWPGEDDLTIFIEILNDEGVEREAKENWPGIGVVKDGFIPVAGSASGDPLFINHHDGLNGPLYLIDHEKVGTDSYNRTEAVETMLEHYEELLKYKST